MSKLISLGTVSELTKGDNFGATSDGKGELDPPVTGDEYFTGSQVIADKETLS